MRRAALIATFGALLTIAAALPAMGGGWAVTTLDSIPDRFDAGQTYAVSYTIRQHGVTPVNVEAMDPSSRTEIRVTDPTSKTLSFPGVRSGATGHYVAQVSFPAAGTWTWEVTQGPFAPQGLGTITVLVAGVAAPAAQPPLAAPAGPAATAALGAQAAPVASGPARTAGTLEPLLAAGLILALAGAAALLGTRLASVGRPTRA